MTGGPGRAYARACGITDLLYKKRRNVLQEDFSTFRI
jgi:hypothetical protein